MAFTPQVQTNFQQCGETQFLTVIPEADNINHVVVFLTGTQPFPDGLGGSGVVLFFNFFVDAVNHCVISKTACLIIMFPYIFILIVMHLSLSTATKLFSMYSPVPFSNNMVVLPFTVYFSWPDPNKPPTWHLLGNITNEKPSAIFKISGLKQINGTSLQTGFTFGEQKMSHNAQIGISVS